MDEPIASAEGINGMVSLFDDRVRISRKGKGSFLIHGLKGDKEIQISSVSSIQFKECGRMSNGYIQFAFFGGQESKGGLFLAASDENTVMFKKSQQPDFEALRTAVQRRLGKPAASSAVSAADEIEKLARLRDQGILTSDEFEAKKRQLLSV